MIDYIRIYSNIINIKINYKKIWINLYILMLNLSIKIFEILWNR